MKVTLSAKRFILQIGTGKMNSIPVRPTQVTKDMLAKKKHSWMFVYYRIIPLCISVGVVVKLPRKTAIPNV